MIQARSENKKPYVHTKEHFGAWDKEAVDLSWKLYQPNPAKRNTREAVKPWEYDKYLRCMDDHLAMDKYNDKGSFKGKTIQEQVLEEFGSLAAGVNESLSDEAVAANQNDFQLAFRLPTPNGARIEAAKVMGYRIGLNQFKNPKPYDFRGVFRKRIVFKCALKKKNFLLKIIYNGV